MGGFALATLGIKLTAWAAVLTLRLLLSTAVFAWRRPWAFMGCMALLPLLLALPEYIA